MALNSSIEWTDHTANLWWGCTEVHAGCNNCYARALDNYYHHQTPHWGNEARRLAIKSVWRNIAKMQRTVDSTIPKTKFNKNLRSVFVQSMSDIFEKPFFLEEPFYISNIRYDTTEELRYYFLNTVVPASPNLLFLLLTKRPGNILKYIPEHWHKSPPANVMFGASISDQQTADTIVPQLLRVPGKLFLSIEPMLGPIDLDKYYLTTIPNKKTEKYPFPYLPMKDRTKWLDLINWVIVGGESGVNKRPFNTDWARSLREQCAKHKVPFFFKQIDKVIEKESGIPEDLQVRQFPEIIIEA